MHTLSLFPSLLGYQFLAIFLIRVALGLTFLRLWYIGWKFNREEQLESLNNLHLRPAPLFLNIILFVKLVGGTLLVIGLWAQGAALTTGAMMLIASAIKLYKPELLPRHKTGFCLLVTAICFALLFLGAGAFAFDLPL
jgi:uncharacterized membrane protein YphA (DoxX/SURF4 family)